MVRPVPTRAGQVVWGGNTAGGKDKDEEGVTDLYPNPHRWINRCPQRHTHTHRDTETHRCVH